MIRRSIPVDIHRHIQTAVPILPIIVVVAVLLRKRHPGPNRHARSDDAIPTEEPTREHVHRPAFSTGETSLSTEQLPQYGLDAAAAHVGEAVRAIGGDHIVVFGDCVLDADGDRFLARGKVAEAADLFGFVEPVGGQFEASERKKEGIRGCISNMEICSVLSARLSFYHHRDGDLPDGQHVTVQLFKLGFCCFKRIRRRIEIVGFEAVVRQGHGEWLVVFLHGIVRFRIVCVCGMITRMRFLYTGRRHTCGTSGALASCARARYCP